MAFQKDIINIARNLMKNRDYPEAERVLLEAQGDDDSGMLSGMLAELCLRTERLDEAERYNAETLARNSADSFALQRKGDILVKRKRYAEALDIYDELSRMKDRDPFLLKRIARAYELSGDRARAAETARKAAALFPDRHDLHYLLFRICKSSGNQGDALRAIETACSLDPDNSFYRAEKLSLRASSPSVTSQSIEEALELSDNPDPQMLKVLARKLKKEGNLEKAIQAFTRVVAIEDDEFSRKELAYALYKNGEYARAFSVFIGLSEENFRDSVFLSVITKAAVTNEEKTKLAGRMAELASTRGFNALWGRVKKIRKEISNAGDS